MLLHRDVEGATVPLIALPLTRVGYRAGQELADRGHRRIAVFATASGASFALHREGLERSLRERGL